MQKWKYLQLSWHRENGKLRYAEDGKFKPDWDNSALHTILNNLGAEGWELVAVSHDKNECIFKQASEA